MSLSVGDGNILNFLAGAIVFSTLLSWDASVLASVAEPYSQARIANMQKNRHPEGKVLIADAEGTARVLANVEKFDRVLDQLDRDMPRRQLSGLLLPVTEKFKDLLLASKKMEDAVNFFKDVGLQPIRTNAGNNKYDVSFDVHYDRLVAQGRTHFLPADVLVIRYTVAGPEDNAEIESLYVVLMNDSSL